MKGACTSCDRSLRKGSVRRAWVVTADGFKYGMVCARCALRSVVVVPPAPTTVAPTCKHCRKALASVCSGCFDRCQSHVRELTAANVARVKA